MWVFVSWFCVCVCVNCNFQEIMPCSLWFRNSSGILLGEIGPFTGPSSVSVCVCVRSMRVKAKLLYLYTHPCSSPGLNRWFLFFLADLWWSHKRPLLWQGAKRLRLELAKARQRRAGENARGGQWGGKSAEGSEKREKMEDNNGQSTLRTENVSRARSPEPNVLEAKKEHVVIGCKQSICSCKHPLVEFGLRFPVPMQGKGCPSKRRKRGGAGGE